MNLETSFGEGKTQNYKIDVHENLWCTIVLLSVHPRGTLNDIKNLITINKSPVQVLQQFISLTELFLSSDDRQGPVG